MDLRIESMTKENIFKFSKQILFQIPLRFLEIFPNTFRPLGLWIFGFFFLSNLICAAELSTIFKITSKNNLPMLVKISIILTGILMLYHASNYHKYYLILKKEKLKGTRYNQFWRKMAYTYMLFSMLFVVLLVSLHN